MGISSNSSYPTIPVKQWWKLRQKALQKMPTSFNADYIATALDMQENSAKANVLPALIQFGFVDESEKPTDRFNSWRSDDHYPDVCAELLTELYPSELRDAIDAQNPDKPKIVMWFIRNAKVGERQAQKMSQVFLLLLEADPSKQSESTKKPRNSNNGSPKKVINKTLEAPKQLSQINPTTIQPTPNFSPAIHIDLQIHIAPETSAEQINKIFESIAKHLFKHGNTNG